MLMHPFSVFSRAKVRSIRKAKNILMHRKNNQKSIKKPIIGTIKPIGFEELKKTKNNPCNHLSYTDFLFQIGIRICD